MSKDYGDRNTLGDGNTLADRENAIGNVQLPTECVPAHPESMRAAIDAAMSMEGGAA